jgi:hypothetical protein
VSNIPIGTPMSVPLYGIRLFNDWSVIDRYWNSSIAELLKTNLQPNMYMVMMELYHGGEKRPASLGPPNRKTLSQYFCQVWLGDPGPRPPNTPEPPDEQVKREAVTAVGWIYHDVLEIASNGAGGNTGANGGLTYNNAVGVWTQKNAANLERQLAKLQEWLQNQPN